jgi:hypothetical protein
MDVEDRHSIYVMAQGHTQEDVTEHVRSWVSSPAVQSALASEGASDDYHVSLATNYEGEFLGYGFIYCTSPALYHILLGRQPTGLYGVMVPGAVAVPYTPEVPHWDGTPRKHFNWSKVTDLHHPPKVLEPRDPLVSTDGTFIQLKPARIQLSTQTRYLRVWSVPEHITAQDLWLLAIPYTTQVDVHLCHERNEAVLVFPEFTYDANFAAFFLRKAIIDDDTILVFRPLRPDEPLPMYKSSENYP